jgi:hypothetical protein
LRAIPAINPPLPKIIIIPGKPEVLAVFHIPFSEEGPHIPVDQEKRIFWKRTNKGKDYMTYEEIKMAFQPITREERKEHSLYLNEIFKELSAIKYTTEPDKTFSLKVPDSYQEYLASMSTAFISHGSERPYPVIWIDIKYLDHLEWVLSHLKHHEYAHIYQSWLELNQLISEYNQIAKLVVHKLIDKAAMHMKQNYHGFAEKTLQSVEQTQLTEFYDLRTIYQFLFGNYKEYILDKKRADFNNLKTISDKDLNNYQIVFYEGHNLGYGTTGLDKKLFIQSSSQEKLDIDNFRKIFDAICDEPDLIKLFSNLQGKIIKIDNVKCQFRKQLETLIKNIKAGYIMKGSCLLRY